LNRQLSGDDPLARLERLIPQLPKVIEAQRLGEELARVEHNAASNRPTIQRFSALVVMLEILKDATDLTSRDEVSEFLERVVRFASQLARASSQDDLRALIPMFDSFKRDVAGLERCARQLWSEVNRRQFGPLGAVGEILQGIEGTADLGGRLASLVERARLLGDRQHTTMEEFAAGTAPLRAEADRLKSEIASLGTDPQIDAFLTALAAGRAALRLATPSVLGWLDQMGALDRFEVRPR
jgi:hypothetical protein